MSIRITILSILLLAAASTAHAQSRARLSDVDVRLQRVEKVLDQSLLNMVQQIDSLKQENRQLRGELESVLNELEQLKRRNRELYRDTDQRISALEGGGLSTDPLGAGVGIEGGGAFDETRLGDETQAGQSPGTENGQGVFIGNNTATSVDTSSGPQPPRVPITTSSNRAATQAEKAGYSKSYDLLARGENRAAIEAFNDFLIEYPDGPYSDNAWYWQGEAKYAEREFDEAMRNFQIVVQSFPVSPKVPDARLKIGFALYEKSDFASARRVLTGVQDDYPGRSAAVLARKRLQKMNREGQ
jgi:tol-pal system protein YbgF